MKISSLHRCLGYCCPVDCCKTAPINILGTLRCKQRNRIWRRQDDSCCFYEILWFCLK